VGFSSGLLIGYFHLDLYNLVSLTLESGDDAVGPALDGTFSFLKAMPPLPPGLF